MDWLAALNTFFKFKKDVYDKLDDVQKLHDYSKKMSKKKSLDWNDLKYFENSRMEAGLKNAERAIKYAEVALKSKVVWPRPGANSRFSAACKAADKFGHDSKQAKAAVDAYRKDLVIYSKSLGTLLDNLESKQKLITAERKTARALEQYARVLIDAFMTCGKIPSPGGSAQSAKFFSLAQDAQQFASKMGTFETLLEKLESKNLIAITEGKRLISNNAAWVVWATKDATTNRNTLKQNEKAMKPKR